MVYYLLSSFDARLKFNTEQIDIRSGDIYYFNCDSEQEIEVVSFNARISMSYNVFINRNNCYAGKTKVINLNQEEILIQLLPLPYLDRECRKSNIYMYDGFPCIVELYDSIPNSVCVKYKELNICNNLINNNYKINIFEKKIKNNNLLFICFENNIKKYYIIVNKDNLIFKGFIKEININENNLIILLDNINCLGQKKVIEYDVDKNTQECYAVEYEKKIIDCPIEIKFLEAVRVCNRKLTSECIGGELAGATIEDINEYLEEFDDFIEIEKSYILIKNFEAIKCIHLEIIDNKIVNIFD